MLETPLTEWKNLTGIISFSVIASVFVMLHPDPEVFAYRIFWVNTGIASFFSIIYVIVIIIDLKQNLTRAIVRAVCLILFNSLIVVVYNYSVDYYNEENGTKVEKKDLKNKFSIDLENK